MAAVPTVLPFLRTLIPARPAVSAALAAHAIIWAFAAFNLAYIAFWCPHDLAPDEAHYWDWSRNLDVCYYSKGPLVAWLIRGSCELFGSTPFAIRVPAVVANALLLMALVSLTRTRRMQLLPGKANNVPIWNSLTVVLASITLPGISAGSFLHTIDPPFLAAWAWAAVFVQRALAGSSSAWMMAGLLGAVGVLAKYTMLLLPAGVGLCLLFTPHYWQELRRSGFWCFLALTLTGLIPIVIWNARNDWVGVRHVFALSGADGSVEWLGPVRFLGGQFGLLVGVWFVAWVAAIWTLRPWRTNDSRTSLHWWLTVPVWLIFAVASGKGNAQPNWPIAAYVTGFPLAIGWLANHWDRRFVRVSVVGALIVGVAISLGGRFPGPVRPVLAVVVGPPSEFRPAPIRRLDPTCRLAGWRTLAQAVDRERDRVTAIYGNDPLVAGMTWTLPGELGFYCQGHPKVYSFGPALDDRHSQYDVWRPNPCADAQAFHGRTFVYVGDLTPDLQRAFDRIDPPVEVIASDGGIPVAEWKVWVLWGFRGFTPSSEPDSRANY